MFLFFVFFPLIVASGAALLFSSTNSLDAQLREKLFIINNDRAHDIRSLIVSQENQVASLAASQVMRNLLSQTPGTSDYDLEKRNTEERILRTKQLDASMNHISLLSAEGVVVASTDTSAEGKNWSGENFFQKGKEEVFFRDAYRASDGSKAILYGIVAPIRDDATKELRGVLFVSFDFSKTEIAKITSNREGLGSSGEAFLINEEKYFLTPSLSLGSDVVLRDTVDTENARSCFTPEEKVHASSEGSSYDSSAAKDSVREYIDYRSVAILGTHTYLPETGWCFISKIDRSEAYAPTRSLLVFFLAILVVFFGIFLFFSYFVSKKISDSIVKLHRGVKIVVEGNLDYVVGIDEDDEIGDLSKSFDVLVSTIKKSRAEVDEKVKQQTAELVEEQKKQENQQKALVNVLDDVEAEKKRVENLVVDLKKFELALGNISDHVVITDKEGIVVYGNKMVEKITGYTLEEAIGRKAGTLWHLPMSKEYYENLWDTIKSKKETFIGEFQNRRKNGDIYTAEVSISPVLDDAKNILFFVGIERDVTKERKAFETNSRLATIVRDTDDAIFSKSLDGVILSWNSGAANMYGYSEEEAVGKNVQDLIVPEEKLHEVEDILERIRHGERVERYESVRKRRDGSVFEIEMTVSPLHNSQGVIVGASIIARDITKVKEVDRAKTEFVSLASHQLRTPLSAINWYTEMLLAGDAGKITKTQKEYLEEVSHGSKRMAELVGALLNVSRIEMGTFAVEPELTDIVALANDVLDELKLKMTEKHLHIETKFANNFQKVSVDPNLTRIVFQNLLTNAVKYTPEEGKVSVSVDLLSEGNLFSIVVSDTGYGIPKNEQSQIFTKLFRATNIREKETDGTGLGLYIIKSIVEHSGGTVNFVSEEGKGTTFTITLPISGMSRQKGNKQIEWKENL